MGNNRSSTPTEIIVSLGISIPLYNEEGSAEQVLHQTMFVLRESNIPFHLAVVNNGSTDRTGSIVDEMSQKFSEIIAIHFDKNQGYGGGILAGMRALSPRDLDIVGWMWGDGQVAPDVLPSLYNACQNGHHMAKAYRIKRKDGLNRFVITGAYASIMRALGTQTKDINGCPKLFTTEAWRSIDVQSEDWFLDTEVILTAEKLQWAIHQASVTMEPRYHNESKVGASTLFEFALNISKWKLKR
jgi:glycosyltransferase involved in cell wall biosynthesis